MSSIGDDLLSIAIIGFFLLWAYSKVSHKPLNEILIDIKNSFGGEDD